MRGRRTLLAVLAVHVALTLVHGLAHRAVPVHVHGWQYGHAVTVIVLAPVVGAVLLVRGRPSPDSGYWDWRG